MCLRFVIAVSILHFVSSFKGLGDVHKRATAQPEIINRSFDRKKFISAGINAILCLSIQLKPESSAASIQKTVLNSETLPNRSTVNMQYEMLKNGLRLEDQANYADAERQWTELIDEFNAPLWRESSNGNKYLLARAYANRGGAMACMGRQKEALSDYSSALNLVPDKYEFWLCRGMAYEGLADEITFQNDSTFSDVAVFYETALSDYDRAMVLDPAEPMVYTLRGDVMVALRKYTEALESFKKGLMLNPSLTDIRCKVAMSELQCGNIAQSNAMIVSVLNGNYERPDMILAKAIVEWKVGNFAESKELFKRASMIDSRLVDYEYLTHSLRWPEDPAKFVGSLRSGTKSRIENIYALAGEDA
mmetsp:Transcript_13367/g.19930  ORF Transcript_13367/g.19930 Transcript_13367/m.19930 type:complete len:362 (+) Transcript_13367:92-1177(+)